MATRHDRNALAHSVDTHLSQTAHELILKCNVTTLYTLPTAEFSLNHSFPDLPGQKLMCPCQDGGTEDRQTLDPGQMTTLVSLSVNFQTGRWVYIPKGQSQLVSRPVLISTTRLV